MKLEEVAGLKMMLVPLALRIRPLMSRRWQFASMRDVKNRAGCLRLTQGSGGELHVLLFKSHMSAG